MNRPTRGWHALLSVFLVLMTAVPVWASQAASTAQLDVPQGSISPFAVQSLIFSQQKITALDGHPGDQFGCSVAIYGDTALVGAYNRNDGAGAAYVFVRSGATWTQQAVLTAGDGQPGDRFGITVALSGGTALVGADQARIGPHIYQGAVYVFVRSSTSWTQVAKLVADDGAENDRFGSALALSVDTALVGVPYDAVGDNGAQGSAYVFARSESGWSQQAHLLAGDGAAADWFGYAVALSGDTALVGAVVDDIGAQINQGSAYIFTRSGSNWEPSAKLTITEGLQEDRFGYAVALAGDTALASTISVNSGESAVYVFTGGGSSWTRQAQWTVAGGANYDNFGQSLSLAGGRALVGAHPAVGRGSAYLFTRSGAAWLQQAQLSASDGAANDQFAASVSLSANSALVGAPGATVGSNLSQGAAYLYQFFIPTYLPLMIH